ncbi:MAG: alpha/beta fold hydrolase, partial [Gemmatimonadota bacterium]
LAFVRRFMTGAAAGAAAVMYARAILRRNDALRRPRVHDGEGAPLGQRVLRYSDGEEVEVIDAGPPPEERAGPTLLWVPGADGPKETFRYQLPHFARRWRVVAADLRSGFGPDDEFDRFADDLLELIEALDAAPVILVGQSLGSAISLRFTRRFPERVRGLVLANPLARIAYDHVGMNRALLVPVAIGATRYLPTPASRALALLWSRLGVWIYDDSPGRDRLIDYALYTGPRTVRGSVSGRRVSLLKGLDLRPEVAQIDVPALVVKGPRDVYCPPAWAREIAEALPGARYVEIPETGHCSHISSPGAFNRVLDAWLRDVVGDADREGLDVAAGPSAVEGGHE